MPPAGQPTVLRPGAKPLIRDEQGKLVEFGGIKVYDVKEAAARGVCLTIYGPAGAGKTTLAATAARNKEFGYPAAILDFEGGSRSIAEEEGVQWLPCTGFDNLVNFYQAAIHTGPENFPWRTVIVDNLSEIAEVRRRELTVGDTTETREWNMLTKDMKDVIRDYRDLSRLFNINVFLIAWDLAERNEQGGIIGKRVNFSPKLASQVPGVVDLIGYLEVHNDAPHFSRILHLEANPRLDSKWRVSPNEVAAKMPRQIVNPTMDTILATLRGGVPFPAERYQLPK